VDPDQRFLYAASPNGQIHKLALANGHEASGWPVPVTRDPIHEKLGAATTMFVGAEGATAAYALAGGRLKLIWQNSNPGTSPILAGGLRYVYDPSSGGIYVYKPNSGSPIAKLPGSPGHWNSPIVLDGHVIEPEGDANDHSLSGTLDLFSAR
jgi:hypothetical protein